MEGCIEFQGCRHKFGYGLKKVDGRNRLAHRLAYCEHHGLLLSDIKGVFIRHKCDNPPCINPEHLEPGTPADNMRDMVERGRSKKGEKNAMSKLTEAAVIEIFSSHDPQKPECSTKALAKRFGVSKATISAVLRHEAWVCVKDVEGLTPIAPAPRAGIGISWHKATKKWQVRVKSRGKSYYIGVFKDEDEARSAYLKAKRELSATS